MPLLTLSARLFRFLPLHFSEKTDLDENGNYIVQKILGPHLLRVVYRLDGEDKVIITAYKTSKLKKYR